MMNEHDIYFKLMKQHINMTWSLMVIVILLEAAVEEILARNLLGYLISLEL